jgi:vacuolar-type H+-ATPase subunit H
MAKKKTEIQPAAAVEEAMNQVLQAERDAERAIADCAREAQEILTAAQKRSQRVSSRADERITRIQVHWTDRASRKIKAMERAERMREREQSDYQLDQAALTHIAETVAAYLTGPDTSVPGRGQKPE